MAKCKFIIIFSIISMFSVFSEHRVALIIGNSNYAANPLKNPVKDATDMAETLKNLNFEVIVLKDSSRKEILTAFKEFGKSLTSDSIGLFYYAGHGTQIDGKNYLMPVGAEIETQSDVEFEAVDLDRLIRVMEDAKVDKSLIFLDACRDNPYASSSRSGTRGLTVVSARTDEDSSGSLIAFATSPGSVAADGDGDNGTFTAALLKYIQEPGLEINQVMTKVRGDVMKSTKGKQQPWTNVSLTEEFYFTEKIEVPVITDEVGKGGVELSVLDKADVYLDGVYSQTIEKGSKGFITDLVEGDHIVEFRYGEYIDQHLVIIQRDEVVELASVYDSNPLFNLNISIKEIKGVSVFANGKLLGEAPIAIKLPVEEYQISFEAPHIQTKNIKVIPEQGDRIELLIDDLEYIYGEILLEGIPEGSLIFFDSSLQKVRDKHGKESVGSYEVVAGNVSLTLKHDTIQDYRENITLNEGELKIVKPELVKISHVTFNNKNDMDTIVKLTPTGQFNERAEFGDLDFTIAEGESKSITMPEGKYNVSYYKPGDDNPGLKGMLIFTTDNIGTENIKQFDYSIVYKINQKQKERAEIVNKIDTAKRNKTIRGSIGWSVIASGLGILGYSGYNLSELNNIYGKYNSETVTDDAVAYRMNIEELRTEVTKTSLIGGAVALVGTVLNLTLPNIDKREGELAAIDLDIAILQSKLNNDKGAEN